MRPRRPQQHDEAPSLEPPLVLAARHDQEPRVLRRRLVDNQRRELEDVAERRNLELVRPDAPRRARLRSETQSFARKAAASGRRMKA